MGITQILASIDYQIAQLKRARTLLGGAHGQNGARLPARVGPVKRKKRNLTPEGRKRIAEAVKRRWEAQRKAAASAQN
jgi:hypothetical protein